MGQGGEDRGCVICGVYLLALDVDGEEKPTGTVQIEGHPKGREDFSCNFGVRFLSVAPKTFTTTLIYTLYIPKNSTYTL